jgi:thiol-disulfide isomerase/thioredoxin
MMTDLQLGWTMRLLSIMVLVPAGIVNGQQAQNHGYSTTKGTVVFHVGIPRIAPIQQTNYTNLRSASIAASHAGASSVDIIWGTNITGGEEFWLVVSRFDGTIQVSTVTFAPAHDDTSCTLESLALYGKSDLVHLLELCLMRNTGTLQFKWLGAGTNSARPPMRPGSAFPDLVLHTITDQRVRVPSEDSMVIVINWWAIWCAPCIEEIPCLNKLVDEFKGDNVRFVAIATNDLAEVRQFISRKDFGYEHVVADNTMIAILGKSYPRNIIIDERGKIVFDEVGGTPDICESLKWALDPLVQRNK